SSVLITHYSGAHRKPIQCETARRRGGGLTTCTTICDDELGAHVPASVSNLALTGKLPGKRANAVNVATPSATRACEKKELPSRLTRACGLPDSEETRTVNVVHPV